MTTLALRLAACSALAFPAWSLLGPQGLVYSSVLFALALARPLVDAAAGAYGALRRLAFRDIEGRHCAYRGIPISVADDADGQRWLRLADVRKVLPGLVRDESLQRLLGPGVQALRPDRSLRIRADALVAHLSRARGEDAARFGAWTQRTLVFPARDRNRRDDSGPEPKRR